MIGAVGRTNQRPGFGCRAAEKVRPGGVLPIASSSNVRIDSCALTTVSECRSPAATTISARRRAIETRSLYRNFACVPTCGAFINASCTVHYAQPLMRAFVSVLVVPISIAAILCPDLLIAQTNSPEPVRTITALEWARPMSSVSTACPTSPSGKEFSRPPASCSASPTTAHRRRSARKSGSSTTPIGCCSA